jgi:hypothetical protein
LFVAPPAAIFWHRWHQHWRAAIGSAVIVMPTAPQAQCPV